MDLPPEVRHLQQRLADLGASVTPYDGEGSLLAYTANLSIRLKVLESPEGTWWLHT